MKEKINIAELLKDCPNGMELDCILYDNIYFDTVEHNTIKCYIQNKGYRTSITFDFYGGLIDSIPTKCVIFPKGKTTWEGFVPPCKFKVGDTVKSTFNNKKYVIEEVTDTSYTLVEVISKFRYIEPINEDKNWELAPNKFDISTLIPFESRVLVRNCKDGRWIPVVWGFYDDDDAEYPYNCSGFYYAQCIPYEQNKHLLGTTNDCDEFYKNWE